MLNIGVKEVGKEFSAPRGADRCKTCIDDYYRDNTMPQGEECVSCDGLAADCPEGTFLATLDVDKGYYRFRSDSKDIIKCPTRAACGGGTSVADDSCNEGYHGALCSACQVS